MASTNLEYSCMCDKLNSRNKFLHFNSNIQSKIDFDLCWDPLRWWPMIDYDRLMIENNKLIEQYSMY